MHSKTTFKYNEDNFDKRGNSMNNKGQFQAIPDPNPSQIAARAKRIRSGWTDSERLARHATTIGLCRKDKRVPRIIERAKHLPDTSQSF